MVMRKKFYILAKIMACVIVVTFCGGCGSEKNSRVIIDDNGADINEKTNTTEITFYGYKADAMNLLVIEDVIHDFMNEYENIKVTYEGVKGATYWEAFDLRVDADVLEDIIMVDHDHLTELIKDNKLLDLSNFPIMQRYNQVAKGQIMHDDDTVYFLPMNLSIFGMYVNYDLLDKYGQKVPENLKEFEQVCDFFVSQGITPIIANNYASVNSLITAKGMYDVYQMENPKEQIKKFNSGEADLAGTLKPGIELVEMMVEHQWLDAKEVIVTNPTSDDLSIFAKGERPFMITGGWASQRVAALNPQLNYGVYPFPILDDGSVLVMDVNTCIAINAKGENLDAAIKFVEYLTQPDVLWKYCESQSCYTAIDDNRVPTDETIAPCVEYLTNGQSVIGSDYNLTVPFDTALRKVGEELLSGVNAEDAVKILSELLEE